MTNLNADQLIESCGDLSRASGITIRSTLEPLAGPGSPVKPATYDQGRYQLDRRWWGEGDSREVVDVVVIDNAPSQANRLEAALERLVPEVGLPNVVLDLSAIDSLPPHLPRQLSGFRFPHRQADAYLRDSTLGGKPFKNSEIGRALLAATADNPVALINWFPQALLYGFWQSHLGRKRSQAKLARSWVSEIIGWSPATTDTRSFAVKGDPLNLSVDEAAEFDGDDQLAGWVLKEGSSKSGKGKSSERLSELGHGQVLSTGSDASLAGISFADIEQQSTVSLAALRRIDFGDDDRNAAGRALLVALGLLAHVTAFGRSFSLRSGCELRSRTSMWTLLGDTADETLEPPSYDNASALFLACVARAEARGLPVGGHWPSEPLVLEPGDSLAKAIRTTWPLTD